eukprot:TRINITY_DN12686_c0_g1_i1.p1 TRINITY_DN12686_c0_g1~~TRINITY_DN12686_c0_g1_i1.p1  ORF type:complete len:607 (+),score=82.88 TRINITY_DN12686_c0_g1_i1:51-1871(+)
MRQTKLCTPIVLSVVILIVAVAVVESAQTTYYPIDWSKVIAEETNIADDEDIGPCICDLTFSKCDPNCCCDTDCSEGDIQLFTECLPEGPVDDKIRFCVEVDTVRVNQISDVEILDDQLCVKKENNPLKGVFYSPVALSPIDFSCSETDETFQKCSTTEGATQAYKSFSPILAFYDGIDDRLSFTIPSQTTGSTCTGQRVVRYLEDITDHSCAYSISDLQSFCSSLSVEQYIRGVPYQSPSSSVMVTASKSYLCYGTDGQQRACTLNGAGIPITTFTSTPQPTCLQAVEKVDYTLIYKDGLLSVLSAVITTKDLLASLVDGAFYTVDIRVKYTPSAIAPLVTPVRPKGGSPGYVNGLNLIAGYLTTNQDKKAILQPIDPDGGISYTIPSGEGICKENNRQAITFGENTITGCALSLSATEILSPISCSAAKTISENVMRPTNRSLSLYVGQFGNAEFSNIEDWITITTKEESGPSGACSGLVLEANYRFTTARYGAWMNPQSRIISAAVTYVVGGISPTCQTSACKADPLNTKSRYYLKTTVTFSQVEDERNQVVYDPPPGLLELPDDVFYPFNLGPTSSAHQSHAPVRILIALLASCAVLGLFLV